MNDVVPFHVIDPERDRAPPVNYEAEQALLGAILANNRSLDRVADFLEPDHFADPVNGRIFDACRDLIDQDRIANAVTLKNLFERDDGLSDVGGSQYLAELQANCISIINTRDYGQTIHDLYLRRQLIALGNDVVNDAFAFDEGSAATDVIEQTESRLYAITDARHGGDGPRSAKESAYGALQSLEADRQAIAEGRSIGLRTGLTKLDRLLTLKPAGLTVIGARPSMGKTALGGTIAANVARRGEPVYFWSGEMSTEAFTNRLIARVSGVSLTDIERRDLDEAQFDAVFEAARSVGEWPLFIDDRAGITAQALRSAVRRQKRKTGLALVVVDYLGLMTVPRWERERRYLDLGLITKGLKAIAKDLDCHVIALHQLSRAPESREEKRPTLGDLRDSGEVEQDADNVAFIYREDYYLQRDKPTRRANETEEKFSQRNAWHADRLTRVFGLAEIVIAKQRQGPVGSAWTRFDAPRAAFEDLDEPQPEPQEEMVF